MRLNIAAGTAVRFEPGETKLVSLCTIAGNQIVKGGNNLCAGIANIFSDEAKQTIMQRVQLGNFAHEEEEGRGEQVKRLKSDPELKVVKIPRHVYASMYGPTVGDKVRLGDTSLSIVIERDFTVYGDECKFGGGKVLREGMGQMAGISAPKVLDLVITNAIVVDYSGIFKCDIGIKDGLIAGLGKAGNPDVMAKVDPNMIVGPNTEVIAGETLIVTAGGIDTHVHFICPQLCEEALTNGLTTLLGGGFGPATGTKATTCTAAPFHIEMMLRATDEVPMNFGFTGKGNSSSPEGLVDIVEAGAVGLKLHEDWGTTPAAIDACLRVADDMDVQVTIHTDTLNESGNVEDSIAAFKGRTLHTYHSEGAGGGHAPDIITVCGEANVIPSSTNPTRPYTTNTIDEHLDMLMVCHHLSRNIAEDVAFAESRIRGETIAAEDVLHDIGAISIISSDSQAMGRIGEVVTRTWQTAHKMKLQRGSLPEDAARDGCDNFRVARYVAKYTINPAIAHGMSHLLGSVEVGKLADLCLYSPGMFGIRPEIILKGGVIAYSQMGDANASIPTPQPVIMRPMFGAQGSAAAASSIAFVSAIAAEQGVGEKYGLRKRVEPVKNCRSISKTDMKLNDALPTIKVDPETYSVDVTLGNESVNMKVPPISSLPLAQRYMLF